MKAVIIGGGSTYTPELMEGFMRLSNRAEGLRVILVDTDHQKLEVVYGILKRMIDAADAKLSYPDKPVG